MLDLKIIRSESEKIAENCRNRNVEVDIPELLKLDREVRRMNTELDSLRHERNEISNSMKQQLTSICYSYCITTNRIADHWTKLNIT